MTFDRRAVSLQHEIEEIRNAVEGAGLLAEGLATDQFATESQTRLAPRYIAAMLTMVAARLRQLGGVVGGDEDPHHLLAEHNQVEPGPLPPGEQDVFLKPWDIGSPGHPARVRAR